MKNKIQGNFRIIQNKLSVISFLLFMALCNIASAQWGEIKGIVTDNDTKATIPGANVYVESKGMKIGAATDMDGKFTIKPLPAGIYNLYVSFTGYTTLTLTSINVNPDKITFMKEIFLKPNAELIAEIEVIEYVNPLINIEDPGKMTLLAVDLLKLPDNKNLVGLLTSITTDIKTSDDGKQVYFRGARSGSEAYYVDGVLVSSLANALPGMAIGSITAYTGGIPAQYGDVTGGVVIIESKSYFDLYNQFLSNQMNK